MAQFLSMLAIARSGRNDRLSGYVQDMQQVSRCGERTAGGVDCGPLTLPSPQGGEGWGEGATLNELGNTYTVELWFWNGLPETSRPVTGTLFGRGAQECLALGGTSMAPGKLVLAATLTGRSAEEKFVANDQANKRLTRSLHNGWAL